MMSSPERGWLTHREREETSADGHDGSLTLASDDAELTLLKQAAALPDAGKRCYELLGQAAARALNPALRGYLQAGGQGYTWRPGREATEVRPGAARDHTGACS